ncbi:MAG: hypothetical protein HS107_04465 [Thermoflexaceae bacterium]|nr:hypothetical protein [Thermoflexaceae bacterium]
MKSRAMPPPSSRAGAGFKYEDQVGAFFALCLLTERPVVPGLSPLSRIDFQLDEGGQLGVDDVVLTLSDGAETLRVFLSLRSGQQFRSNRFPADFVGAAWAVLGNGADLVGLITRDVPSTVRPRLDELLNEARVQTPSDLAQRIPAGGTARKSLWASLEAPVGMKADLDTNPATLLSRLMVIELDFGTVASQHEVEALRRCGEALRDPLDADAVWHELQVLVSEVRVSGGYLDLERMRDRLRRFRLKAIPSAEPTLTEVKERSRAHLSLVRDTLANGARLDRSDVLEELNAPAGFRVLLGSPGTGKAALARHWTEAGEEPIWLRPTDIRDFWRTGPERLSHALLNTGVPTRVVIDGLDRVFDEEVLKVAGAFLHQMAMSGSSVEILLTTMEDEWGRLSKALVASRVQWDALRVVPLKEDDLRNLLAGSPRLLDAALRSRSFGPLRNLKVLDTLVGRFSNAAGVEAATVDEASFSRWFVEDLVAGTGPSPTMRRQAATQLAIRQALTSSPETPISELELSEAIDELIRDGICQSDHGRIRFSHGLYGDWIRANHLESLTTTRLAFLVDQASAPSWHRALRLYFLGMGNRSDSKSWRKAVDELDAAGAEAIADIALEALLFADDEAGLISKMWPELCQEDSDLFSRLLGRFLHVATLPDPRYSSVATGDLAFATRLAARYRLPWAPLWLPVLKLLGENPDEVVRHAWVQATEIANLWLRSTPLNAPRREDAASLAVAGARRLADDLTHQRYHRDDFESKVWLALFAAALEEGPAVAELTAAMTRFEVERPAALISVTHKFRKVTIVEPTFRSVCLSFDGLEPLIRVDPMAASTLIKRCLQPGPEGDDTFRSPLDGGFDIVDTADRVDPFFGEGPFLTFLRLAPHEALACLIEVMNVCVERWVNNVPQGERVATTRLLVGDSWRTFSGTGEMLFWHRGDSRVPSILSSSLMAFEKYCVEVLDAGGELQNLCDAIWEHCHNLALVGVLLSVAARCPERLSAELRPLMTSREILVWDRQHKATLELQRPWMVGEWMTGKPLATAIAEWHDQPFRKLEIQQLAIERCLLDPSEQAFLERLRTAWAEDAEDPIPHWIGTLIAAFDVGNWFELGDGRIAFQPPQDLLAAARASDEEINRHLWWIYMPMRLRRLVDGDEPIPPEAQLEPLWRDAVERLQNAEVGTDELIQPRDIACGVAAVFLSRAREWCGAHPDVEDWCRQVTIAAFEEPQRATGFDSPFTVSEWSWDFFAAETVPILLAENPTDRRIRAAAAQLVSGFHIGAVRRFFAASWRHRANLGEDFLRLQHLALIASLQANPRDGSAHAAVLKRRSRGTRDFISGKLAATIPPWAALMNPPSKRPERRQLGPGIYLSRWSAAWDFIQSLDSLSTQDERERWTRYYEQSVLALCTRLRLNVDRYGEADGTPFQEDYALLRSLPLRILEMRPSEAPARLWQPLIEIGPIAHYWTETFLRAWIHAGLIDARPDSDFEVEWRAIIDFASQAPSWKRGNVARFRAGGLWNSLLGLDGMAPWSESHRRLVREFRATYAEWASQWLDHSAGNVGLLARFCSTTPGRELLPDGLIWIGNSISTDSRPLNEEGDELAGLLLAIWQADASLSRLDASAADAFRRILLGLVAQQHEVAMELASRMGATPT